MARMLELAAAPTAQTAGSLAEGYVRGLLEKLPDDYTVIGGITRARRRRAAAVDGVRYGGDHARSGRCAFLR